LSKGGVIPSLLNEIYEANPYFEKWGKGRPSKKKIAKRKLSHEWESEQRKKHPGRTPMISFLLSDKNKPNITKKNGKIMIEYVPRNV
jgi:hypothetical protein